MTRVLLDADGVFVDFISGYLDIVEDVTGKRFAREQVNDFDIATALGLSRSEVDACAAQIVPGWCRGLAPIAGAVEGVKALLEIAHVYVVTSPWKLAPTWSHERTAWIVEHLGLSADRVLHGSCKEIVSGDVFVDDKTSTCIAWANANPQGRAVVWRSPWNEHDPWSGYRFNDWGTLHKLVRALSR